MASIVLPEGKWTFHIDAIVMSDGTVNVEQELALFLEGRLAEQRDQRLLAALRCIAQDLHLSPNADDVAEKLSISRRTIERLFRSHFGLSFGQVVSGPTYGRPGEQREYQ